MTFEAVYLDRNNYRVYRPKAEVKLEYFIPLIVIAAAILILAIHILVVRIRQSYKASENAAREEGLPAYWDTIVPPPTQESITERFAVTTNPPAYEIAVQDDVLPEYETVAKKTEEGCENPAFVMDPPPYSREPVICTQFTTIF
jgi:hypothetical protein